MRQGLGTSHRLETGLRVDPRVVLASHLLQLTQGELEQAIETELNENPALERLADSDETITDESILKRVAPQELRPSSEDVEFLRSLPNDDTALDWIDLAGTSDSLTDHLSAQLLPQLPPSLKHVGGYMIGCISEKGYLAVAIEEIALDTRVSIEEAEVVLKYLQSCEPAGIGATNLHECLLLQLRTAETYEQKLARAILKHSMDDFLARRVDRLCRRYKVLPEVVAQAFDVISMLNPFPGEAFSGSRVRAETSPSAVQADLILSRSEAGWEVEVRGFSPQSLSVNRYYQKRLAEIESVSKVPKDEKRHVQTYVQRANDFIAGLCQREHTLVRIGRYLVESQLAFVSTGQFQFLAPLTRSKLAKDLDLHESTVSRATQGKFVQLPNGEIVSFDVFFKPALRVQKMIEEILANENPNNPLSDDAIAVLLAKKGVLVARRTVNKYRDRTRHLSSRKRRSA
jgi:RNA polymerase sigma-54 factor